MAGSKPRTSAPLSIGAEHEIIIEPGRTMRRYWSDLWQYRELFYFLAWRDLLVRYKQTVIGVAWSVLRPLLTMIVFSVVFGEFAGLPAEGAPYPLLVLAAMLPWQFFANALGEGSVALLQNTNLLTKVYFPRMIIPCSSVVVSLVDFLIALVLLGLLMVWYGVAPSGRIFLLPLFFFPAILAALGLTLWLAALNVKYRDFRYVVPFIVQFGLYISPVGFSSSVVPASWRLAYSANPMVGVIDGFRWAVLGGNSALHWPGIAMSTFSAFLVFVGGIIYFRATERYFADII